MKRIFGVVLCLLFVFIACKNKVDNKQKEKEEPKSSSANILSMSVEKDKVTRFFAINENDDATATLTLSSDHTLNLTEMKPIIEISKGAKINPPSEAPQDFSPGKTVQYTVTAENGTTKVYTASVTVLPARRNLEVESITICGEKVKNNKVTIAKDVAVVKKGNVQIVFKGDRTPTDFTMNVEKLILNKKGDKATVKFSTVQNDAWNAWTSPDIEVKREGSVPAPSSENKILTFEIGKATGEINHLTRKINCVVPKGTDLKNLPPILTCSPGATVMPKSGDVVDFSSSETDPVEYTVKAEDGISTRTYNVTITVGKSKEAKILSFKVNNISARINHSTEKILLELDKNVPLSNITPVVKVSDGGTYSPQGSRDFTDSETNPVNYTVWAEDSSITKTYKVTIKHKQTKSNVAKITKFDVETEGNVLNIGVIDDVNMTIKVEVPKGTDLKKISPIIETAENATVNPASDEEKDFSGASPVQYTVTSEDTTVTKIYNVTVRHKKSREAEIETITLGNNSEVGFEKKDTSPRQIILLVPFGTNLKDVTPSIKQSAGAIVSPSGAQDFSDGKIVTYTVTSEDGNVTNKYAVKILQKTPECVVKIHGVPTKEVDGVMKVYLPTEKKDVKVENLTVYYGTESPETTIPSSQLSLGRKNNPNDNSEKPTLIPADGKIDLDDAEDTTFFIILDMGKGFAPSVMKIVVTRTPLAP